MRVRTAIVAFIAIVSGGCWDFIEPDFPGANAPAVLQMNVTMNERGVGNLNAVLVPGLDFGGFERVVPNDTLIVNGLKLGPTSLRPNGTRDYTFSGSISATNAEPRVVLAFSHPRVEGIAETPPDIRWYGVGKLDPDTVFWTPGTNLVLRVDTTLPAPQPFAQIRQWFLQLQGSNKQFRISSDGLPPAEIVIPPSFIPEAASGTILVTMTFQQSAQYPTEGNTYLSNINYVVFLTWIVRVTP